MTEEKNKVTLDVLQLEGFKIKVHGKHGLTPVQAEPGSAGYDLHIPEGDAIHMPFNSRRLIDTGVIVQTPIQLFMLMVPRSSSGTKRAKSVRIANTVGIIDSSYQGKDDTLKVFLERENRKKEYIGTFDHAPSLTNSSVIAQAHKKFGVPMTSDKTELIKVGEGRYDVYSYSQEENDTFVFKAGDRFAQVLFIPYARPELVQAALEEFDRPDRGGFGSTGK